MDKKIIFFDIDGTIVDHFKNEIPSSTIKALKLLIKNGHKIAIASGKGPKYIENMFEDINFDTYVAYNGNYVKLNNEIIHKNYINEKLVKEIEQYSIENKIPFVQSDINGTSTIFADNELIKKYYEEFNQEYPILIESIIDYSKYPQLSIMANNEQEKILIEKFKDLSFIRMNDFGLNVLPVNSLKDKGIQVILDNSSYKLENTIAFGDGLNDLTMFKLVNTSVAMGNGPQELKDIATITTTHISDNGIFNACEKLGLFK